MDQEEVFGSVSNESLAGKNEEEVEEKDEEDDEDPAAEVCAKLGPGGPVENIFWAILPTIVTAFPKVPFLRSNLYRLLVSLSLCAPLCK